MTAKFNMILLVPLFASCTAISQKDAFLDALPRVVAPVAPDPNLIFSENFESGLAKWSQVSGSWATATPASAGLALQSPTSASANTFILTSQDNIDLTGRSNCLLKYDIRFSLSGGAGVAAQLLFGADVVGSLKSETYGLAAVSSGGQFVTNQVPLSAGSIAKLTIRTVVGNNTTLVANINVDNISIRCNESPAAAQTLVSENFNGGAANWSVQAPLAVTAGQGTAGTNGLGANMNAQGTKFLTYASNINLSARHGCKISYFYRLLSNGNNEQLTLEWNSARIDFHNIGPLSAYSEVFLTAYEGTATNALQFRFADTGGGSFPQMYIDDVVLTCQQ